MVNHFSVLLVVFATFIGAAGSLFLKLGSKEFRITTIVSNIKLLSGLLLYCFSTIFYVIALKFEELTIVYPITSLTYVWVLFISAGYLKESINFFKAAGIVLIISGVFLIVR